MPDNETIADEVNRGEVAFGVVNQYYWYRLRAELGASGIRSQITYFAPHDPGYVLDVSGAAVLKSSTHKALARRVHRLPRLQTGPGDHRALDQLRVPDRLGRVDDSTRNAVQPTAAERHHDPRTRQRVGGDCVAPCRWFAVSDHWFLDRSPSHRRGGGTVTSTEVSTSTRTVVLDHLEHTRRAGLARTTGLPAHRSDRRRRVAGRPPHLAATHGDVAVEHRATHRRRDGAQCDHRHDRARGSSNAPICPVDTCGQCSWSYRLPSPTSS